MMNELKGALQDQGLTLVSVSITGTDFRKSLNYKELGLEKDVERELATLGRKSVNSQKYPKLLRNNKDQAYKYLDTFGVRFGSGSWTGSWAIPNDLVHEVLTQLEAFKNQRVQIKQSLLNAYEDDLEDFISRAEEMRPGFGDIIRKNAYDKAYVQGQIDFVISHQEDIVNSVSQSAIQGLVRNVKEYEDSILKKAKTTNSRPVITRFTRSKLEEMRDYCYRFTFLTDALISAADLLEEAINCLPETVVRSEPYYAETSKVMTTLKLLHTPDELDGIQITTTLPESENSEFYIDDDDFESSSFNSESEFKTESIKEVELAGDEVDLNVDDIYEEDIFSDVPDVESDVIEIAFDEDIEEEEDFLSF